MYIYIYDNRYYIILYIICDIYISHPNSVISSSVTPTTSAGRGHPSRAGLWLRGFHGQSLAGTRPAGVTWRMLHGTPQNYITILGDVENHGKPYFYRKMIYKCWMFHIYV